jgi:polysaccharide export outer membrane protein
MTFKKLLICILTFGVMALLSACATTMPPPGADAYRPVEYKLAAGDKVKITVFGESRFDNEYQVSSAGDLSFPLIGNVPVTGRSVMDLKAYLEATLSEGYLNDPRVTAEVLNYRPFFILGEVSRPGKFDYGDELTALQAIALAGGFTYRADQRVVFLKRAGDTVERSYELGQGRTIYVAPGDTIRVGERYF